MIAQIVENNPNSITNACEKYSAPITGKQKIIGLRHILTHGYDLINAEIIWKIKGQSIPVLK